MILLTATDGGLSVDSMSDDFKKRIQASIDKFQKKQLPKKPRAKPNGKPEEKVVKEILAYLRSLGFSLSIIEAKATYSEASGTYRGSTVKAGYPDISGCTPNGLAVYVEAKAPGKRSTLREDQRIFLIEKIKNNCFAICADSVKYCESIVERFRACNSSLEKQALLLSELPRQADWERENLDSPIFED